MPGLLYGRRIRITVGDQVVVDLDPRVPESINEARNLDVDFEVKAHAKPEPLTASIQIYGLNADRRRALTVENDRARTIAWQAYQAVVVGDIEVEIPQVEAVSNTLVSRGATVTIEAGYDDDFSVIHRGIILPEGLEHIPSGGHYVTKIETQDNRLAWSNAFVSEEIAPGVSLVDYQKALALSEQFLAGDVGATEVEAQAPGLLERDLDIFGYENGKVIHGQTRDESQKLMDTLGLRPFVVNGKVYYLPLDGALFDSAVVLREVSADITQPAPGGLISLTQMTRGFYKVRSLLNHRLMPGRQVQLLDKIGRPISVGRFRVEHVQHTGSAYGISYYSDTVLRPTTILPQNNG
jgi:hypothetical protein